MFCKFLNQKAFSLVELLAVLVLIATLAAIAVPKFIELSEESRVAVLRNLSASALAANNLVQSRFRIGVGLCEVPGRDDLVDIDSNGDGNCDTRLKWGWLDNTDLESWLSLSDDFAIDDPNIDETYIGYDFNGNGLPQDDNCYFLYTQAQGATLLPSYTLELSAC
ncbi:prepilin-type N-terminal cleavage/methylation domain-containing protein [Agaribacterium haliotis]|uniref:prepilin-type N-terminal cleavage/methylation domain-containing protein n=1 Tax=Agaribacterium haliotis TaxID=2013869 RepID=UPI000BB598C9|nr:prepilin-type N-terminal cleavage/methylation domain-containing protein [Agaribacterium haliotis]